MVTIYILAMFHVRRGTEDDAEVAFCWRNDPVTVANLRTKRTVTWKGHKRWWPDTLAREDARVLIVEYGGDPVGITYFERLPSCVWATHVNSNPDFRGRGLSVQMLSHALSYMGDFERPCAFSTIVKDDNIPAIKMYSRCGFHLVWPTADRFSIYAT